MTAEPAQGLKLETLSTLQVHTFEDAALHSHLARALASGESGYPFFRSRQVAAKFNNLALLDRLAHRGGWQFQRPDPVTLVLRAAGAFAMVFATGRSSHCTFTLKLWAASPELADALETSLLAEINPYRITETLFRLEWRFMTGRGLQRAATTERTQDTLLDESYPALADGLPGFIQRFLNAPESVLVLQGPPGTGKTRLVRAILREMSLRKQGHDEEDNGNAVALYSGDTAVWETDEIFVEFITGDHDAFLIEDADHLLAPRANGNQTLHRFLNISDGIAQAQGRKIIFSTNLPNVGDIDEALVRPGRCFAHIFLRELQPLEARRLLHRLCGDDTARVEAACRRLEHLGKRSNSVAEVYAAHRAATGETIPANVQTVRAAGLRR